MANTGKLRPVMANMRAPQSPGRKAQTQPAIRQPLAATNSWNQNAPGSADQGRASGSTMVAARGESPDCHSMITRGAFSGAASAV
jgi:hypothetical protein